MDTQQLTQGLKQALFIENHRIVSWYDADQSFAEELLWLDASYPAINHQHGAF
jgi:hypothetical protein